MTTPETYCQAPRAGLGSEQKTRRPRIQLVARSAAALVLLSWLPGCNMILEEMRKKRREQQQRDRWTVLEQKFMIEVNMKNTSTFEGRAELFLACRFADSPSRWVGCLKKPQAYPEVKALSFHFSNGTARAPLESRGGMSFDFKLDEGPATSIAVSGGKLLGVTVANGRGRVAAQFRDPDSARRIWREWWIPDAKERRARRAKEREEEQARREAAPRSLSLSQRCMAQRATCYRCTESCLRNIPGFAKCRDRRRQRSDPSLARWCSTQGRQCMRGCLQ